MRDTVKRVYMEFKKDEALNTLKLALWKRDPEEIHDQIKKAITILETKPSREMD